MEEDRKIVNCNFIVSRISEATFREDQQRLPIQLKRESRDSRTATHRRFLSWLAGAHSREQTHRYDHAYRPPFGYSAPHGA